MQHNPIGAWGGWKYFFCQDCSRRTAYNEKNVPLPTDMRCRNCRRREARKLKNINKGVPARDLITRNVSMLERLRPFIDETILGIAGTNQRLYDELITESRSWLKYA